jgi:hypothetical protein
MSSQTILCHDTSMEYEVDTTPPEEAGDGLPNMRRRLRAICATILLGLLAWTAVVFLIRS